MPIDLFSEQSEEYAKFRPKYPQNLFDTIYSHVKRFDRAWDCATGNGQAAIELAKKFKHVDATDLSKNQLRYAKTHPDVTYDVCLAEKTPFPTNTFDLVTVAQALHWLDFKPFYAELKRVLRKDGLFAAWGYDVAQVNPEVNKVLIELYDDILQKYWDPRRRYIDEKFETIPFPLHRIPTQTLIMECQWTLENLINYVNTWSAVQSYKDREGRNPIDLIQDDLKATWGNPQQKHNVTWRIYLLLGRF